MKTYFLDIPVKGVLRFAVDAGSQEEALKWAMGELSDPKWTVREIEGVVVDKTGTVLISPEIVRRKTLFSSIQEPTSLPKPENML